MIKSEVHATIVPSRPIANRIIHIEVSGLRAIDGAELDGAVTGWFITRLDPHFSTINRVRIIAGEFLGDVPDTTIDQLIHYFSQQAVLLNYSPEYSELNPDTYKNYRSRWVTSSTIVSLLSGTSSGAMMQKRLGDMMVKRDGASKELLTEQAKTLAELTGILEDGGYYGRPPETGSKAVNHPDAPDLGRLWAETGLYGGKVAPIGNVKEYFARRSDGAIQSHPKKTYGRR